MNNVRISGMTAGLLLLIANLNAQISLPSIFTDHMVLQQKSEVPVWGWGNSRSTVKVVGSWAPQDTSVAVVGPDGSWKTTLKTTAAGGPYTLHIIGNEKRVLQDVMLGEVWLCSGQSNMEWTPMHNIDNRDKEIAAANYPNIRFFHIPRRGATTPQNNVDALWATCTPDVMKNTSAVAYFFGRGLQKDLNVPVGLIVSAWGGTPAEIWVPEKPIKDNPQIYKTLPKKTNPWSPIEPGALYNQMIHPITPYSLAGAIWYQGESNRNYPDSYGFLLKALIDSWRGKFEKEFPFYLVQIAPFTYDSNNNGPALVREHQEWVSRNVPGTGMVVVSDCVANVKDIHPTDKQSVGLRLANMALGKTYGRLTSGYESPLFKEMIVKKNKAIISFLHAENGLMYKGKQIVGFRIAGADGVFEQAEVKIKNNTVEVSSSRVKNPVLVQYCFDDATIGNLFSKEGLPVAPFRTDRNFSSDAQMSDRNLADKPWITAGGVKNAEWHGFRVYESKIDEFSVWIAEPKTPAKGKPWIMRIQDFGDGFHWQINEKLLNSGAYVVAINSYNVYGTDYGLNLMDSLYTIARRNFDLPEKCVLTGVSRAGLSAYRWAIRHPERVACIYCEGPVLDFKTWPMSWQPSANNWIELKRYYGFSNDEEAIAYKGNPIDNLGSIAKAKIPIRHVISLTDEHDIKIVPNDKNTLKAQQYLQQMGHDMNIVITPEGMKVPYAFDDESVEFMISNATP